MADALTIALIAGGFGIAGTAIGAAGGYFLETLKGRQARAERIEARAQQRDDFQRQTLLELQEALDRYYRAIGDLLPTVAELRSGQRGPIDHDKSERSYNAGQRASELAERVRDDSLRKAFDAFWAVSHEDILVRTESDLAQFIDKLLPVQESLNHRLGEVLRQYL